jgi:lysophospholipase L1-like esterase
MKKYIFIGLIFLFNSAKYTNAQPLPFINEIEAFEKSDSIKMPETGANLFVGSSSIRLWQSLPTTFEGYKTLNRGFGGSTLQDLSLYIDRIVVKYAPAKIFIYSGENDIAAGADANETFKRFETVFVSIREKLPNTPIVFISIKPSISRVAFLPVVIEANKKIRAFIRKQKKAKYADVFTKMQVNGQTMTDIFIIDNLHMNAKGYAIWASTLKKYLVK